MFKFTYVLFCIHWYEFSYFQLLLICILGYADLDTFSSPQFFCRVSTQTWLSLLMQMAKHLLVTSHQYVQGQHLNLACLLQKFLWVSMILNTNSQNDWWCLVGSSNKSRIKTVVYSALLQVTYIYQIKITNWYHLCLIIIYIMRAMLLLENGSKLPIFFFSSGSVSKTLI